MNTLAISIQNLPAIGAWAVGIILIAYFLPTLCGIRYIPHDRVGVIEKLWSTRGSLKEGKIIALTGEAGFQCNLLRGGLHFGLFPWQYRIHKQPLVTVSEGKLGYVYARDGSPLPPMQTLGRVVECNHFQDARTFLTNVGQRGRQRLILREGVYAINTALFVVITENRVHAGPIMDRDLTKYDEWQNQLAGMGGFDPVVIGYGSVSMSRPPEDANGVMASDNIGVVSVHDGQPIDQGELIAPELKPTAEGADHNYFQDPESFLAMGGRRGKQLQVVTDGTFFINRWFATIEIKPKTVIPIGYVGVVVSYYGQTGADTTGDAFRYGEQVKHGERGVWREALAPGKYALNPYAMRVEYVPTVNFVLRWITGQAEEHHYDEGLESIELVTADGYEPVLPLSLVLHIDYQKASSVVQRFGDVRRLISQTLDPILTAYFRDVAQSSHMLDLLTKREEIQQRATSELGRRFQDYDINCVAVLIGRPESKIDPAHPDRDPIEQLFDQLRIRRLAQEQKETYVRQQDAAVQLKELNHATAAAEKQKMLTDTRIEIEVAANRGESQLSEAQRLAKRDIVRAEGESRSKELLGKGEASRIAQIGLSEAAVQLQKIRAYGDPRLFALNIVSDQFAKSAQPLVPERLLVMGGGKDGGKDEGVQAFSLVGQLLTLLLSEKAGFNIAENKVGLEPLDKFMADMSEKASAENAKTTAAESAAPKA